MSGKRSGKFRYEAGQKISNPVAILMRTMNTHGINGLCYA